MAANIPTSLGAWTARTRVANARVIGFRERSDPVRQRGFEFMCRTDIKWDEFDFNAKYGCVGLVRTPRRVLPSFQPFRPCGCAAAHRAALRTAPLRGAAVSQN